MCLFQHLRTDVERGLGNSVNPLRGLRRRNRPPSHGLQNDTEYSAHFQTPLGCGSPGGEIVREKPSTKKLGGDDRLGFGGMDAPTSDESGYLFRERFPANGLTVGQVGNADAEPNQFGLDERWDQYFVVDAKNF